ncbi:nuclear transport factor 2 family protein [Phytohabitans sp. ZYX-F-186]|uniref:Nuclear transport factor 2 family protein n=1 Tax=Phytohabitans maris TaxID=3071409 RepID=A0ABU0ZXN3_9ACTN|nr:nuclear transport factor 2 family protein [Phytohabitans sp. ZYX-F-186]MDQ7911267.1 nuclear transport factor 2 family protein [Phytohabitans sp. ZYX-F-186]
MLAWLGRSDDLKGRCNVADTLSARIQRVEDLLALHDLVARYCVLLDGGRWDDLAELFTAGIDFAGAVGRAEVVRNLRRARTGVGRSVHTPHTPLLTFVDDDHATGVVPTHAELDMGGTPVVCAMRYVDSYARDGGRWRFARRRVRYHYALPWAELPQALTDEFPVRWPGARPMPADEMDGGR